MRGFEITLGVDDLKATMNAAMAAGAALLDGPFTIDGVGDLAFIADTEGNRLGVMQYVIPKTS